MNKTNSYIDAPDGATHLDKSWIDEIPANCVFSKGTTGCGATTLAIKQNGHTIIAMPYVPLIRNKEQQHPDIILGIYDGVTENDIVAYLNNHDTHKICVTFDSLPKLVRILQMQGKDAFNDYFLIIDEWQVLFNSYEFRYDAVRALLDIAPKFSRVTYMSATPIERQYWFEELSHIPEVTVRWKNATRPTIQTHRLNKPVDCIADMCINYDKDGIDYNYHFFVNSVDFIGKVIRKAKLPSEYVKVVCSQSRENRRKNQAKLGADYPIAEPLDPVKRFNFYTSTCFEGCDIYDKKGFIVIVNDGNVPHTMIDVCTLFAQIAGRLRDSDYRGHIMQIYSTTNRKEDVPLDEYIASTEKEYQSALRFTDRINRNNERDDIGKLYSKERFIRTTGEGLVVDRNLLNSDIVAYKLRNEIYCSRINMNTALSQSGFDVIDDRAYYVTNSLPLEANPRTSFRELFDRYCELKANEQPNYICLPDREIDLIEKSKPLVKDAYNKLGKQEVERLNYNMTSIKRELVKRLNASDTKKIITLINDAIPHQKAVSDNEIKRILQNIYNELGIKRTAKATDLREWYEIKSATPKINGNSTSCKVIIRDKVIVYWEVKQQELFEDED